MSIALKHIISISKGRKHNNVFSSNGDGKRRYIQIEDLRNDNNLKYTDEKGVEVSEKDLIIAWDGANAGTIGFGLNGFIGSTLARLRIVHKDFDSNFLGWFLRSKFSYLRNSCTGATIPHINKISFERLEVPEHDLQTQKQIASVLADADRARQQRKAAHALTEQFLQSSFLHLFGDLASNEKDWETMTLKETKSKVQIGPFGTQLHAEDYIENGVPLINPKNIRKSRIVADHKFTVSKTKYDELSNYHLRTGDIIMARRGEMGRCALVTEKENGWFCGTGSLFIRPAKTFDSTFLLFVLTNNSIKEKLEHQAQGVTMANLNRSIINELIIPVPPLTLQQHFASLVADVEILRQKQQQSERKLEHLFQALLQQHFGESNATILQAQEESFSIAAEADMRYGK